MKKITLTVFTLMLAFGALFAQGNREYVKQYEVYTDEYAKDVVYRLADEKINGREAGTRECAKIMKFVAKELKSFGYDVDIQNLSLQKVFVALCGEEA